MLPWEGMGDVLGFLAGESPKPKVVLLCVIPLER